MGKRLIINADDFGSCEAVNQAVKQAHTEGVLTSTTILTNMPAAEAAVEIAKELPTLGVGVHLNLTDGAALRNTKEFAALVDEHGLFKFSAAKLAVLSTVSPQIRKAIKQELSAQIQWVIDRGISPTHLDSHKYIHCFPVLFSMICQLANRFRIPAIRFAYEPKEVSRRPWPLPSQRGREKAWILRKMARFNRLQNTDFFRTEALLGVSHAGRIDANFFKAISLYNPVSAAEVITHPSQLADSDSSGSELPGYRKVELESLCSNKTKQHLQDADIKLIHYGRY